jgi:hypothetical protein
MARVSVLEIAFVFTKQGHAVVDKEFWLRSEERFRTGNGNHIKPSASARSDATGRTFFELEWPEGEDPPREVQLVHGHQVYKWLTSRLGPQPWQMELDPPMGTLQFRFRDDQGQPVLNRRVSVRLDVGTGGPLIYSARGSWQWFNTLPSNADGIASVDIPAEIGFAWTTSKGGIGDITKAIPGEALAPREVRVIDALDASSGNTAGKLRFPEGWAGGNQTLQLELLAANGDALQDETGTQLDWTRANAGGFGSRSSRCPHRACSNSNSSMPTPSNESTRKDSSYPM